MERKASLGIIGLLPKIIGASLFVTAISCLQQKKSNLITEKDTISNESVKIHNRKSDSLKKIKSLVLKKKNKIFLTVKDSTKYSKRFLDGLRYNGPGTKFELIDSMIITDDHYKNRFSETLPLNKEVNLSGVKGGYKYMLKVTRINYTTINYTFKLTLKGNDMVNEQGEADLGIGFMLGSDTCQDDDGKVYGCDQYYAVSNKCIYSIRIGILRNSLSGNVIGCGDYLKLDSCPTLK